MTDVLLGLLILFSSIGFVLLIVLLGKSTGRAYNASEKAVRDELRTGRQEAGNAARQLREEVAVGLKSTTDSMAKTIGEMGNLQKSQIEGLTRQLNTTLHNKGSTRI